MSVMRVGIAPWAHMRPQCYRNPRSDCDVGVELEILDIIATMAGLTLSLVPIKDSGCGKTPLESKNGTWAGLLKMLKDGEIDVIGNLCDMNKLAPFQDIVATSWPVWQYEEQYVIQTPKPPPLSFAPLAPLSMPTWYAYAATFVVYVGFVTLFSYMRYSSPTKLYVRVVDAVFSLIDFCCGFKHHLHLELVWPMWLLIITTIIIFYNTYILSAVLHPFPVSKPFKNKDELTDAMLQGSYRLLSHKSPPALPGGCLGLECGKKFTQAIDKNGFEFIPNAQGYDQSEAVATQNPEAQSKFVMVQGSPFVSLYLSEYPEGRDKLWVIDSADAFQKWSGYAWRADFPYKDKMNRFLRQIGDFKSHALTRYVKPHGAQPHTENEISEKPEQQAIALKRFLGLFYVYAGGVAGGIFLFVAEIVSTGNLKKLWRAYKNGRDVEIGNVTLL